MVVQLAGNDADVMLDAAQIVLDLAPPDVVVGFDVNLGCPQGIARKGRYGAFLFEQDEPLVLDMLRHLRRNLPSSVAVSAKIRLPLHDNANNDVLKRRIQQLLLHSGVDFVTVHGRTLRENKTTVGPCRWDQIRVAVETAQQCVPNFPVVANGGIEHYGCVQRAMDETGAAAVMSSEALLETPNLFSPTHNLVVADNAHDQDPLRLVLDRQLGLTREYLDLVMEYPPLPGVSGYSFNLVRGHLFKMLHRYLQFHPDLRNRLGDSEDITNVGKSLSLVDELESRYASDDALHQCLSARPASSWYRRYWHIHDSGLVHQRERSQAKGTTTKPQATVQERKAQIQERIQQMRKQRLAKEQREEQRQVAA